MERLDGSTDVRLRARISDGLPATRFEVRLDAWSFARLAGASSRCSRVSLLTRVRAIHANPVDQKVKAYEGVFRRPSSP